MKIDKTDIEIIRRLRDGRKPFKQIADELSLVENTVRSRTNKLIDNGCLDISALVNYETIPGHTVAFVGIKLSSMALVKKGQEFSNLRGVISASVVTGQYDLMLIVLLNEEFDLLQFFTTEVSRIKGVQSAETFVVYKGYNLNVPYVL